MRRDIGRSRSGHTLSYGYYIRKNKQKNKGTGQSPHFADVHPRQSVNRLSSNFLEDVFDGFACALEYFGRSLHGAHSDVLACVYRALAQLGSRIDGMKRD